MQRRDVEEKGLFEEIASEYIKKDLSPYGRIARKLRLERTLRNVQGPIGSLLEVGCGAGFSAQYLQGRYDRYVGLDYSRSLIDYAHQYNQRPRTEFICSSLEEFASGERFHVVLMIGVLHHMSAPDEALRQAKRLLKEGGVLIVNEPQKGNPLVAVLRCIRKSVDKEYSAMQVEFTEDELRTVFEEGGYEVVIFPQGIVSTPLAETRWLPNSIGSPLAWVARCIEPALESVVDALGLRRFAWNLVVQAVPKSMTETRR